MAKNVTINFNTAFNANGIKSAIYSLQEMQTVTKNVQQSLEGARTKWAQYGRAAKRHAYVDGLGVRGDRVERYAPGRGNEAAYEGHQRPSGSCQGADLAI